MAKFGDLTRYYDPGLTLTVRGKDYVLPLPSAELGLWCRTAQAVVNQVSAADTDGELAAVAERAETMAATLPELPGGPLTFEQRLLGDAHGQMVADGVPDLYITFCAQTAYRWIVSGEDAARLYWQAGGRPEAMARGNRADRRAAARTGQTSTAGAAATHTPASTSGTRSRKKSSRSRRGSGSRGRKS